MTLECTPSQKSPLLDLLAVVMSYWTPSYARFNLRRLLGTVSNSRYKGCGSIYYSSQIGSLTCKDSDWQSIQVINHLPIPLEQYESVSFAAITNNSENLRYNYKAFFCDLE